MLDPVMIESFFDELEKIASLSSALLHPAVVGAGLGAAGGALMPTREGGSRLGGALGGAVAGGTLGAGIKYLPSAIRKSKALKALHPHATDVAWIAPSLLVAPAAMEYGSRMKLQKSDG